MMAKKNAISIEYFNKATQHTLRLPLIAFKKPVNQQEYDFLEEVLDQLIDEVRGDEKHPLALAMQIIGDNLEEFDGKNFLPIGKNVSEVALVEYLMKNNNLLQKDLIDIFSNQGNVSKFLNGERKLSKTQIAKITHRFKISADFFF